MANLKLPLEVRNLRNVTHDDLGGSNLLPWGVSGACQDPQVHASLKSDFMEVDFPERRELQPPLTLRLLSALSTCCCANSVYYRARAPMALAAKNIR